jgi:hypothetical protein
MYLEYIMGSGIYCSAGACKYVQILDFPTCANLNKIEQIVIKQKPINIEQNFQQIDNKNQMNSYIKCMYPKAL